MIDRRTLALALVLAAAPGSLTAAEPVIVSVVAPGQPGTTEDAAPTLSRLAAHLETSLGRAPGSVRITYFPERDEGRASLDGAAYAFLPLALALAWEKELGGLRVLAQVETERGTTESFALVRPRGSPPGLGGVTVRGSACVDARFVRRVILAGAEGAEGSEPVFARRTLSALRKLPDQPDAAVLVDEAQAEALDSLPFGDRLEAVFRSSPRPGVLVVALVRAARPEEEIADLRRALLSLHRTPEGAELAADMRMTRYVPPDEAAIDAARTLYGGGAAE
jgi:hypothetical protein